MTLLDVWWTYCIIGGLLALVGVTSENWPKEMEVGRQKYGRVISDVASSLVVMVFIFIWPVLFIWRTGK